jgi:hypothetical protein
MEVDLFVFQLLSCFMNSIGLLMLKLLKTLVRDSRDTSCSY